LAINEGRDSILPLHSVFYLSKIIPACRQAGSSFQQKNRLYTLDLAGHNIKHTTSIRRRATPARHKSKPVSDPIKNNAVNKDKTATKKSMI